MTQKKEKQFKEPTVYQVAKKARGNHIWLNAFSCINPTDEFKIQLADMVLGMLDDKNNTLRTTLDTTDMLYLSINKS